MNIDKRLDRLTERHEALTQTVELLARMQQDAFEKNQILMARVLESIDSLVRIANARERRITDLERGPN